MSITVSKIIILKRKKKQKNWSLNNEKSRNCLFTAVVFDTSSSHPLE